MSAPGSDLSFFWHDYETFGLDTRRNRPAQFAGVRTNLELEEIDEPVMFHCHPSPDTLPDPGSVLLTGILPQKARQEGLPEHAFAHRIEAELARPGTIGVGYNSLRFDDEVTRFLFWRNLLDPYSREWRNGCGRWDLLEVVRAAWALRPDGIQWPTHASGERAGRTSLKLEDLTRANGLSHDAAHDALSDVRATLALARLVKSRQPRLWDFCLRLRRRDAVLDEIGSGRPFVHLSGRYPAERGCMAVVWPLAVHPSNRNELIVWDLAEDPEGLLALDAEAIRERLFTRQEDLAPGVTRLPIKTVHLNKSPVVFHQLKVIEPVAARWGLDLAQALRHAERAASVADAMADRWAEVFKRPAAAEPPDVDEALYDGFVGDADRARLQRLSALEPAALAGRPLAFDDPRLEELVFRYRARNAPESLDEADRVRWQQHLQDRLLHGHGGTLTLQVFLDRIDALAEQAIERDDERAQGILEALVDHGESLAPDEG